jgi:hypothetical protein
MTLQFEPIQIEKQQAYLRLLRQCPQIASDYSFLNLWGWAENYGLCWAWDQDLVWIKQTRPQVSFWAPVGPWLSVDWKQRLAENKCDPSTFIRVPGLLIDCWREKLEKPPEVIEERGHWDYLYAVNDLVELGGNRFHKKKNLLNQFKRSYAYSYVPLAAELVKRAMEMQTDWCTWRDCESFEVLSAENRAILRVLQQWNRLEGTLGGALMVDQSMVAYTVAEALTEDTILIHFEKGDTAYKGVYQAINQMFLAHSARGFKLVNREQDLNDEGLRKAKLSYLPVDFLRKYQVDFAGVFDKQPFVF